MRTRKWLAVLLAVMMACTMLPVTALAAEEGQPVVQSEQQSSGDTPATSVEETPAKEETGSGTNETTPSEESAAPEDNRPAEESPVTTAAGTGEVAEEDKYAAATPAACQHSL